MAVCPVAVTPRIPFWGWGLGAGPGPTVTSRRRGSGPSFGHNVGGGRHCGGDGIEEGPQGGKVLYPTLRTARALQSRERVAVSQLNPVVTAGAHGKPRNLASHCLGLGQ